MSIFLLGFSVSHFRIAHGFIREALVILEILQPRIEGCLSETVDGICLGASINVTPPYEQHILDNLPAPDGGTIVSKIPDFNGYLAQAVGWDNIPASTITCRPYEGMIEECLVQYGDLLTTRFLFRDGDEEKPLVVILHGHVSSAGKVMGIEPEDYMRKLGVTLAEEGYPIAALDLTHSTDTSARLNGQLALSGFQIYGLWARFSCDVVKHFPKRRAIIYGLSNGGIIADHASVLCDAPNISSVFVDDIIDDWRKIISGHPSIHAKQNYVLYYLSPLQYDTSYLDFILSTRFRKVYTRSHKRLEGFFPLKCLSLSDSENWRVLWSPLKINHHVAQTELFLEFLKTQNLQNSRQVSIGCVKKKMAIRE